MSQSINQLQAVLQKWAAAVPRAFPNFVNDNHNANVVKTFVEACVAKQVEVTSALLDQFVLTDPTLHWTRAEIAAASNAEKEKAAAIANRKLREALGLIVHDSKEFKPDPNSQPITARSVREQDLADKAKASLISQINHAIDSYSTPNFARLNERRAEMRKLANAPNRTLQQRLDDVCEYIRKLPN